MLSGQILSKNELVGNIQSQVIRDCSIGITDVMVDGVSVVTNGIANIKLSDLEKVLQDILTVIQGSEIDNITISQIEELIVAYFENKTVGEVEN